MLSVIVGARRRSEMPTTNVGNPAVFAAVTAATAPGPSSSLIWPLAGQFGWPSVASTMNFGFGCRIGRAVR